MNYDNIAIIGTALKWRSVYDLQTKYYQENIVTACGSVFRCKALQSLGEAPVKFDDNGFMEYDNSESWDVVVDMSFYFNNAIETRNLCRETLEYAQRLDEELKRQNTEIITIKKDNQDQWNSISDLEKSTSDLQEQIKTLEGKHDKELEALSKKHEEDIEALSKKHEEDIKAIYEHHKLDFEKIGNDLNTHIEDQTKINTQVDEKIEKLNNNLNNTTKTLTDAIEQNHKEHEAFEKKDEEFQTAHDALVKRVTALEEDVDDLAKKLAEQEKINNEQNIILESFMVCFSVVNSGRWDNNLLWDNEAKWSNTLINDSNTVSVQAYDPVTKTLTI